MSLFSGVPTLHPWDGARRFLPTRDTRGRFRRLPRVSIDAALDAIEAAGHRARILIIVTLTAARLRQTHRHTGQTCPFEKGVLRRTVRQVMLGTSYENGVNNQRAREGRPVDAVGVLEYFEAEGLWGGLGRYDGRFTARHVEKPGRRYLVCRPKTDDEGQAVELQDAWYDGATQAVIPYAAVEHYLYAESKSRKQGVHKTVAWRTIGLEGIEQITYAGKLYLIERPKPVKPTEPTDPQPRRSP